MPLSGACLNRSRHQEKSLRGKPWGLEAVVSLACYGVKVTQLHNESRRRQRQGTGRTSSGTSILKAFNELQSSITNEIIIGFEQENGFSCELVAVLDAHLSLLDEAKLLQGTQMVRNQLLTLLEALG